MASQDKAATFSVVAKDAASSVLRGVGKEMGRLGKTGGAVFKTLAVAAAAVASAITAAAAAAVKFTQKAIQAAIQDDAEQQKLIATLKTRGLTTELATKRVNELIEAGQKLAFTDSETRAGIGIASQYTKNYAKQTKILTAAQNLARARNISLEAATKLVGKAYSGSGAALKGYGVQLQRTVSYTERKVKVDKDGNEQVTKSNKSRKETIKGVAALALINEKFAGVAEQYSKTFEGQFSIVRDSINETVEAIGGAIGGGEGLPTFVRLLEGIRPVVDDLIGEINKNLPNIEKFSRELVEKFLAKLPGFVATAKRELPILIQKATDFIGSVAGFAKDIGSFLGPDGLITAGIAGVGFKMGGLAGGIGAVFAEQFIKMGIDPITATITGTIGGAITAGVVQGFGSAVAQAAVKAFLGLFKSVPVSPSLPVGGGGGVPPIGTAPLAQTVLGVGVAAIATVAAGAMAAAGVVAAAKVLYDQIFTPEEQEKNMMDNYAKLQARVKREGVAAVTSSAGGVYGSNVSGGSSEYLNRAITSGVVEGFKMAPMQPPIDLTNRLELKLDGKVIASSVKQYLGITTMNTVPSRVNDRNR
jgi:hypothetical protein